MNQEEKDFYSKPGLEQARQRYYDEVCLQIDAFRQFIEFMREAGSRGFSMKLHIEVDGVAAPSGPILLKRKHGSELTEFLFNWACGNVYVLRTEEDEIVKLWPEVARNDGALRGQPGGIIEKKVP